jgi:hypothetical protein
MRILAPFPGLVVVKTMWRMGGRAGGDHGATRSGPASIIDVIDTSAIRCAPGESGRRRLVHEDRPPRSGSTVPELSSGRVARSLPGDDRDVPDRRTLVAIVSVDRTHAQRCGLTASVEIAPAKTALASSKGSQ